MSIKISNVAAFLFLWAGFTLFNGLPSPVFAQQGIQVFTNDGSKKPKLKKSALSASIQTELNRLGCKAGRPDGQWGRGSKQALGRLVAKKPDLKGVKRSKALLSQLRTLPDGICVLSCAANQQVKNGTCVALTCENGKKLEPDGSCSKTLTTQIKTTLTGLNNLTGLFNVGRFDGRWLVETKGNKRCATRADSYYVDIVKSKISGQTQAGKSRKGKVTPSGRLEIKGKPDSGPGRAIILTAKIKETSGKGKLKLDRGADCRGTFVMTRQ